MSRRLVKSIQRICKTWCVVCRVRCFFRLSPTNSDYLASVLLLVYSELIIYPPDWKKEAWVGIFFFNCDVLASRPHRSLASSFISCTLMKKTEKKEGNVRKLLQEVSRNLVFVLTAVNYSSVKHPSASISSPPTHKAAVKDLSRRGVVQRLTPCQSSEQLPLSNTGRILVYHLLTNIYNIYNLYLPC